MLLAILTLMAAVSPLTQEPRIYLFDCAGAIQPIGGPGTPAGQARHVSAVDTTLPAGVRDGCAIRRGWFDGDGRLALLVQTRAWARPDGTVPTETLTLSVPGLVPVPDGGRPAGGPGGPDWRALRGTLDTLAGPFATSVGYLLADGRSVLLQEVNGAPARPRPRVVLRTQRRPGVVALAEPESAGTGRFAIVDAVTGTQRGLTVSDLTEGTEVRVVCATPHGLILLAVARDALLMLDVARPEWRVFIPNLELDLYWTACAVR